MPTVINSTAQKQLNKIQKTAVTAHTFFDRHIWPKNPVAVKVHFNNKTITPSYHNENHILATLASSSQAVAHVVDGTDPFGIQEGLDKWNTTHKTSFSLAEFEKSLQVAFACHDLGNITHTPQIEYKDDNVVFDYEDHYDWKPGATETRSTDIAHSLLNHFLAPVLNGLAFRQIHDLVLHLIQNTIYVVENQPTIPFWTLVQTIDQVGSYYFCKQDKDLNTAGFMNELCAANYAPYKLNHFINFVADRLVYLNPDPAIQKEIIEVFNSQGQNLEDSLQTSMVVEDRLVDYNKDIPRLVKHSFGDILLSDSGKTSYYSPKAR